ncbi:MAG: Dps family protein [Candidatus Woesearchaeota archaeon]
MKTLQELLANTYALLVKTHNYHWNVVGEEFFDLHQVFEEQYTYLFSLTDEIAERIRAKDEFVPASLQLFAEQQSLSEPSNSKNSRDLVQDLYESYEKIIAMQKELISESLEQKDYATSDFVTKTLKDFEKTAWMLRSKLYKE